MAIKYFKLFDTMARRGLKKMYLVNDVGISAPTLAKLSKGENVETNVISKICKALDVQPGDIMEYVKDDG